MCILIVRIDDLLVGTHKFIASNRVLWMSKVLLGRQYLAEMLLYALNGHSDYQAQDNSILACLCSLKDYHYFRFVHQCATIVNPRRACTARVTVVVPCVCVCVSECFYGPHLQLTQLSDKVGILAVSI